MGRESGRDDFMALNMPGLFPPRVELVEGWIENPERIKSVSSAVTSDNQTFITNTRNKLLVKSFSLMVTVDATTDDLILLDGAGGDLKFKIPKEVIPSKGMYSFNFSIPITFLTSVYRADPGSGGTALTGQINIQAWEE